MPPPATVSARAAYDFRAGAFGPDGDRLTFTVRNPPSWTRFDPATGRPSGRPAATDVRQYGNIDVTVPDGQAFAQPCRFSVEVAPRRGEVTLTWRSPVANSHGSSVVDLAEFIVYYGTSPALLNQLIAMEDPRAGALPG